MPRVTLSDTARARPQAGSRKGKSRVLTKFPEMVGRFTSFSLNDFKRLTQLRFLLLCSERTSKNGKFFVDEVESLAIVGEDGIFAA